MAFLAPLNAPFTRTFRRTASVGPSLRIEDFDIQESGEEYARTANYRTPDWRWTESLYYKEFCSSPEELRFNRKVDPWVAQYVFPFALVYNGATDLQKMKNYSLRDQFPAQYWAKITHDSLSYERSLLEACLVSDAPYERISEVLKVPTSYILFYEKAFFDTSRWIDHALSYTLHVLQPALDMDITPSDFLCKLIGWRHSMGFDGLTQVAGMTESISSDMAVRITALTEKQRFTSAVAAMYARRINSFNTDAVIEQLDRMLEMKQRNDESARDKNLLNSVQVFLSSTGAFMRRADQLPVRTVDPRDEYQLESAFAMRKQNAQDELHQADLAKVVPSQVVS